MLRPTVPLVAAAAALTLPACGGDSGQDAAKRPAQPDRAAGPAAAIARAQGALRTLHSFHLAGTNVEGSGTMRLEGDWARSRLRLRVTQAGTAIDMILVDK